MKYRPNADQARVGDWIQTFSGTCFYPLDPRPEEISILDIAHANAMRCRHAGHCVEFYSVNEHSVLVSENVSPANALWGLLHDAAEAYSSDIPRPLKRHLKEWPPIERRLMVAVCLRYGMALEEPEEVTHADFAICADERAAIMAPCERDWGQMPPPLGVKILCLPPRQAKAAFLRRFLAIMADHNPSHPDCADAQMYLNQVAA